MHRTLLGIVKIIQLLSELARHDDSQSLKMVTDWAWLHVRIHTALRPLSQNEADRRVRLCGSFPEGFTERKRSRTSLDRPNHWPCDLPGL